MRTYYGTKHSHVTVSTMRPPQTIDSFEAVKGNTVAVDQAGWLAAGGTQVSKSRNATVWTFKPSDIENITSRSKSKVGPIVCVWSIFFTRGLSAEDRKQIFRRVVVSVGVDVFVVWYSC